MLQVAQPHVRLELRGCQNLASASTDRLARRREARARSLAKNFGIRARDLAFERAVAAARNHLMSGSNFGIVGLGTMGRNLALNIEAHGFRVAVWNLETEWTDDFIGKHPGAKFTGTPTLRGVRRRAVAPAADHDDDPGRASRST